MVMAAGCVPAPHTEQVESRAKTVDEALGRARSAADDLGRRLTAALGEQLAAGDTADAIDVCSKIAPAMAAEMSRDGLEIRRTSLRYRNPENAPDPWERGWLERLDELHSAGELPREISEPHPVQGELRYLRPVVVAPGCLQCHGGGADLGADVRERIAERYPDDEAKGYSAGDLRGAFSVRVRLDVATSD